MLNVLLFVGCVYGNGNQYYGNASFSATGRECLSWSDPSVTRSLMTKVSKSHTMAY